MQLKEDIARLLRRYRPKLFIEDIGDVRVASRVHTPSASRISQSLKPDQPVDPVALTPLAEQVLSQSTANIVFAPECFTLFEGKQSQAIENTVRDQLRNPVRFLAKLDRQQFSLVRLPATWELLHALAGKQLIVISHAVLIDDKTVHGELCFADNFSKRYRQCVRTLMLQTPARCQRLIFRVGFHGLTGRQEMTAVVFDLSSRLGHFQLEAIEVIDLNCYHVQLEQFMPHRNPLIMLSPKLLGKQWEKTLGRRRLFLDKQTRQISQGLQNYLRLTRKRPLAHELVLAYCDELVCLADLKAMCHKWLTENEHVSDLGEGVSKLKLSLRLRFSEISHFVLQYLYQQNAITLEVSYQARLAEVMRSLSVSEYNSY